MSEPHAGAFDGLQLGCWQGSAMLAGTEKVAAVTSSITSATSTASQEGKRGPTSKLAGTKRLACEVSYMPSHPRYPCIPFPVNLASSLRTG